MKLQHSGHVVFYSKTISYNYEMKLRKYNNETTSYNYEMKLIRVHIFEGIHCLTEKLNSARRLFLVSRKSWGSWPWLMATALNFFLLPEGTWQEKVEGCRRDSWRQPKKFLLPDDQKKMKGGYLESRQRPSILLFWLLKLIQNLDIACFLAKTLKKIPRKKINHITLNIFKSADSTFK